MTPRELPAELLVTEKHEREVWVGDLPMTVSIAAVRVAFESLIRSLPEYQERYPNLHSPVVAVRVPPAKGNTLRFVFVEFEDAVLASTAVSMSGFQMARQSVRVNRPASGPLEEEAARGLDVEPLRSSGQIPWASGAGATMLTEIFLGGFAPHLGQSSELLRKEFSKALLAVPAVQTRFPDLQEAVLLVKIGKDGAFAFADLANEVLASTAVAMGSVTLSGGHYVRTGWPTKCPDAVMRAPPPLEVLLGATHPQVQGAGKQEGDPVAGADEDPGAECEVYIGGIRGLLAPEIWSALAKLLQSLTSYGTAYPGDISGPVVSLRTGSAPFAFARLADPVLASTAVALGWMPVCGRRCQICRPSHYRQPPEGDAPPLKIVQLSRPGHPSRAPRAGRPGPPMASLDQPLDAGMIWVGNLVPVKPAEEARHHLDQHLTGLALSTPGYDLDAGPPVKRISMHHSGRFAFVEVQDATVAEQLIPIFDGSDYMGHQIAVNWAHPKGRRGGRSSEGIGAQHCRPAYESAPEEVQPAREQLATPGGAAVASEPPAEVRAVEL